MTLRLCLYLSGLFLQRFLVTMMALVALLGVLDALSNADLLPEAAGFAGQMRYMWLRLPVLFDRIVIFGYLLATLLTYASLFRRNELVAISASGISVFGQIRTFVPVMFLTGVMSAALIDATAPPASRALQSWLGSAALQADARLPDRLWISDGPFLVEIGGMRGQEIRDLRLFERDAAGSVVSVTTAALARHQPQGWSLAGTSQQRFDDRPVQPADVWASQQTPASLALLLAPPRDLSVGSLISLSQMRGSGSRPSGAYLLWALNRLFLPITALGFLILAIPLMQVHGRRSNADLALAAGVGAGFVYMVGDGILKTLAENGSLSPFAAVLLPNALLVLAGFWLALGREIRR